MKNQPFRKLSERLTKALDNLPLAADGSLDLTDKAVGARLTGRLKALWPYEGCASIWEERKSRNGDPMYCMHLETRGGSTALFDEGVHVGVLAATGLLFTMEALHMKRPGGL